MLGYVALLMLTDKLEDIAVEALGYILSNSEYARLALTEFVGDGGITIDDINRVQTQDVGETLERPDIAFRNTQGEKHLLIEAKFGAVLTENQPLGYLRRRPCQEQVVLLFVSPDCRVDSLWQELLERLNGSKDFSAEEMISRDELRSARVSDYRVMMCRGGERCWGDLPRE